MRMELQGIGLYVNLSSGIKTAININGRTPVCTFFNNPRFVHKPSVRRIAKYLASTSTYVDSPDVNRRLTTRGVFYKTDIEKVIKCYVDAEFSGGWAQAGADHDKMACCVRDI